MLITGASSYVGARIFYDFEKRYELVGTYYTHRLSSAYMKLDLTDTAAVAGLLKDFRPEVVVHVANYPNARLAEGREEEYRRLNLDATRTLVDLCNRQHAKLVFVSGQAALITDNPYGLYKYESENIVRTVSAGYLILRPRLIYGISPNQVNDRTFNRMIRIVESGTTEVSCDHTWKFQPTYIGHLSQMIDQAIWNRLWNLTVPVMVDTVVDEFMVTRDVLGEFGIKVQPLAARAPFPLITDDLTDFHKFQLRPDTYDRFIETLVSEIRNRQDWQLSG